jgi:hypothetical protein
MRLPGRRHAEYDHARGPVAAYAGILDGRHLWLAVEPTDDTLALRDTAGGDLIELEARPEELLGGVSHKGVRSDLTALVGAAEPGGDDATYDVVVKGTRLLPAKPLWSPALPDDGVARTPPTPEGRTLFSLERTDDGHLRVRRTALAATAELDAVDVRGDRVHLRIRPPDDLEPGCHLLLLDQDDQLLETVPATTHEGLVETLVGVDDLPADFFGMLRPAVGTEQSWVRIRRRSNDLADPNHAVLLPELFATDAHGGLSDHPRARFRWNPDGLLAVRSIDPDEAR